MTGTAQRRGRPADHCRPRRRRAAPKRFPRAALRRFLFLTAACSATDIPRSLNGYATFAAAGKHTEPYPVRRITHNGAPVPMTTPTARRAIGAEDLATSLEPLPLKGIAGTPADSVPYAVWSGAMGLADPRDPHPTPHPPRRMSTACPRNAACAA